MWEVSILKRPVTLILSLRERMPRSGSHGRMRGWEHGGVVKVADRRGSSCSHGQ